MPYLCFSVLSPATKGEDAESCQAGHSHHGCIDESPIRNARKTQRGTLAYHPSWAYFLALGASLLTTPSLLQTV